MIDCEDALQKSDEEIVALYREGNEEALQELIHRFTSPLFNFIARLVGERNAPDVVQDVFIKVWKFIGRFDENKASFKTWVFRIARNTATDFLRKKKSILFSDMKHVGDEDGATFALDIPDESILPDEVLQKLDDVHVLNRALEALGLPSREVLVLHYQEEMTFDEIGKVLDKPLNTVKSQHRRALISLRDILTKD